MTLLLLVCLTGAAFCQVMDACFPGKVSLSRVNFNAYLTHEIAQNYKILQKIFATCKVHKYVDAEVLAKGRFIENLEFLQWLKCFYETNGCSVPRAEYRARERRRLFGVAEPRQLPGTARKAAPATPGRIAPAPAAPAPGSLRRTAAATSSSSTTAAAAAGAGAAGAGQSVRTPMRGRVLRFAPSPPLGPPDAGDAGGRAAKRGRAEGGADGAPWEVRGLLGALADAEARAAALEARLRAAEGVCTEVLGKRCALAPGCTAEEAASLVAGRVLDSLFPQK